MTVTNKRDMLRILKAGGFGNTVRTWTTWQAFLDSGFDGRVGMRWAGDVPGGPCYPNISGEEARRLLSLSDAPHRFYFYEAPPDDHLVLQGEYDGEHLTYSVVKVPMRAALATETRYAQGLEARLLLRGSMSPSSHEDLFAVLEHYPDHVVEFSVYSVCLGELKGRNTIFWEVRLY